MKYAITLALLLAAVACSKEQPETRAPEPSAETDDVPAARVEGSAAGGAAASDEAGVAIFDEPIRKLGEDSEGSLAEHRGKALLIVNVASKCGFTDQYEGLEELYEDYRDRGLVVLGFPCNQFGGQEPGSEEQIKSFCRNTYSVKFPMYEKIEVNGPGRHPIYAELTRAEDGEGEDGDIQWNFEKFVVSADGKTVKRFRSRTKPRDPELVAAIEAALP